jgi:hypothetical protein
MIAAGKEFVHDNNEKENKDFFEEAGNEEDDLETQPGDKDEE